MKYTLEWEEWVYDAEDELEGIHWRTLELEAADHQSALALAETNVAQIVDTERADKSHGLFASYIIAATDESGIRLQVREHSMIKGDSAITSRQGNQRLRQLLFSETLTTQLKGLIGQTVTLSIAEQSADVDLGSIPSVEPDSPSVTPTSIVFLGIYGVNGLPLFVLGRVDGQETIWRDVHWSTSDEDTGLENHRYQGSILKLNGIDLAQVFQSAAYRLNADGVCEGVDIGHLFGYRGEIVQGQVAKLNWGTPMSTNDARVVAGVKKLEQII